MIPNTLMVVSYFLQLDFDYCSTLAPWTPPPQICSNLVRLTVTYRTTDGQQTLNHNIFTKVCNSGQLMKYI